MATFKLLIDSLVKILPEVIKILFSRKGKTGEKQIRGNNEERTLLFPGEMIESHKSEILIEKGELKIHIPESIESNKLRTIMKGLRELL
jgi:hypothetical protein